MTRLTDDQLRDLLTRPPDLGELTHAIGKLYGMLMRLAKAGALQGEGYFTAGLLDGTTQEVRYHVEGTLFQMCAVEDSGDFSMDSEVE